MLKKVCTLCACSLLLLGLGVTAYAQSKNGVSLENGKEIFHARGKPKYPGQVIGNCTACHWVVETELQNNDQPGNVGPALLGMKARYPNKQDLFNKIWNSTNTVPNSIMPPFGADGMMTKEDVQSLVEYVYSL